MEPEFRKSLVGHLRAAAAEMKRRGEAPVFSDFDSCAALGEYLDNDNGGITP